MPLWRPDRNRPPRWPYMLLSLGLVVGCTTPLVARQGLAFVAPAPAKVEAAAPAANTDSDIRPAPRPKPADLRPLQVQLKEYIARQEGTYGVYVIDLKSGRATGVNADMPFPTASTFKVPLAMFILDEAARGRVDLDEPLAYDERFWEEGTGILQETIAPGDQISVRKLVELSITESDNIATNMLIDRFGLPRVYEYMKKLGGKVTIYAPGVLGTTPKEMANYLRSAMSSRGVGDSQLREFLFDSLSNTAFHERVEAGVPTGVKVAHKIGTLPGVVNDVALVYGPEREFIVSVYSLDVDEEVANAVIAEIGHMVYNFESELE